MTQDKDQMRAEFEARQFRDISTDAEQRERNGHGYRYMGVDDDWDTWQAAWQAARASAPRGVPEGWQLVPVKPTAAMKAAGMEHCLHDDSDDQYRAKGQAICVYSDMLAAAPQPVAQEASDPAKTLGDALNQLLVDAEKAGYIITVDLLPQKPLAMGNMKMLGAIRPSRALYSAPVEQKGQA